MIRRQVFIFQMNAVQADGADLVMAHGQPRPTAAHQVSIDPHRIYKWNQRSVFDDTDPPPLKVVDLEAEQFGKEQKLLIRHRQSRKRSEPIGGLAPRTLI
jgi:hypothetical protein